MSPQPPQAIEVFYSYAHEAESLKISKNLANQNSIYLTLNQLGNIAYNQGDLAEADERPLRKALSIFERLGSPYANLARRDLERITGES